MMFTLGLVLFSSVVMLPQFLQTLMGYTAQSAGMVLSASGVVILIQMPIVGQLTTKYPAKCIIGTGWLLLAGGLYYAAMHLNLLISMESAVKLRVIQAFGIGFLFVPITMVGYIGIAPEKSSSVSGLVNFTRNIGSSVGTSLVTTVLWHRSQVHQAGLAAHTTSFDPAFQSQVNGLATQLTHAGSAAPDARLEAYARIYRSMEAQATTLAYIDTFMMLAIAAAVMLLLTFIVRRNDPGGGAKVVAH
jgi:DHA2 family multidrug resistance protein